MATPASSERTPSYPYSVRQCAVEINNAIEAANGDAERLSRGLAGPMTRLMERPDLLDIGLPRQGNNVAYSRYLYFDTDITIIIFKVPQDSPVQPHDHGTWESLFVYRGEIKHTMYRRVDDGRVAGEAKLEVVRDGVLKSGDFAIVAPPDDIHGFVALNDDTYGISVVKGEYKPIRNYYDPGANTVVERRQVTSR